MAFIYTSGTNNNTVVNSFVEKGSKYYNTCSVKYQHITTQHLEQIATNLSPLFEQDQLDAPSNKIYATLMHESSVCLAT
ncbi:hypothetical protein CARUB_v10012666mg [Capsella rubella]|uniref:Uncharacterized protein n=1 Tax=Capsella rubella TaxID=81985 RepID=R0IAM4_9BRAS|nr:hypothetical protein CARUB_v10012666mg [Capsella rubella]